MLDELSNTTVVRKNTKDIKVIEQAQPFDISKTYAKYLPGRIGFADVIAIAPCDVYGGGRASTLRKAG